MMSISLLRAELVAPSAALGGFGIFYLYYSFVYRPVASYALSFLGTTSAIDVFGNVSASGK